MKKKTAPAAIVLTTMSRFANRPSAPDKMMAVNNDLGNPVNNQQSTSRVIYHALPLDGRTTFKFFENVQAGTGLAGQVGLPWNNINENKLQVKESLVIRRLYFCVILTDAMSGIVTGITDLTTAGLPEFYCSDYSTKFDTMTVAKPNPLSSQLPVFSKNARHTTNEWIWLDNDAVIPSGIQFTVILETPVYTPVANAAIRLVMEGFGSLFSPKQQF